MFVTSLPRVSISLSLVALLMSCEGSSDPLREDEGKVSYYSTGFSRSQSLFLIAFEGGLTYGFYQSDFSNPNYPEYAYAGFFVAHPQVSNFGENRLGWDFDFDAESVSPIELSPAIENGATITTTLQTQTHGKESIVGSKASVSELPTDTASLPGDYALQARSSVGSFKGNATLSSARALVATDLASCGRATKKPA